MAEARWQKRDGRVQKCRLTRQHLRAYQLPIWQAFHFVNLDGQRWSAVGGLFLAVQHRVRHPRQQPGDGLHVPLVEARALELQVEGRARTRNGTRVRARAGT